MAVWLTFGLSVLATAGFFGFLYALICLVTAKQRRGAMPRLGILSGETQATLNVWVSWNAGIYAIGVYRLHVSYATPDGVTKEGRFSVTFDPPQKGPFVQPIQLPHDLLSLLTKGAKGILTVEVKTVEGYSLIVNYSFDKMKSAQLHQSKKIPTISNKLKSVTEDPPAVSSLDWTELQERKKKVKELEAQAKVKAEKAAQAVAAAAAKTAAPPSPVKSAGASAPAMQPSSSSEQKNLPPPQDQPVVSGVKPVLKT